VFVENHFYSLSEAQRLEARDFVYYDIENNTRPYALAFFMFRAGAHNDAVEFLEQYPEGHDVRSFAELYRRYILNPNPSDDEISEV